MPGETLEGYQGDESNPVYNANTWIMLNRGGVFGHCAMDYPIKFMENLPIDECVFVGKACTEMDFNALGQISVF